MEKVWNSAHIYGTVKVGERGQIVIPSEARKDFNITPGDLLLVVTGPRRRGLTLIKADSMKEFLERLMRELESPAEIQQ
jgi:AbrB family looped-hinge helix DNA binding protein